MRRGLRKLRSYGHWKSSCSASPEMHVIRRASKTMKSTEQQLLNHCPGCGRRLFAGGIFSVVQHAHESGIEKVYGLNSDSLDDCTALYLGCVISDDMTCPACGAAVQEAVEVEYSDKCELCHNHPCGTTWYWDFARRCNVGLCPACSVSPAGEAWIDARS